MDESWSIVTNKENAWHVARRSTIGSSDIATILGISPYKTPMDLWRLKVGLDKPEETNFAQQSGKDMEPIAREWFNQKTGRNFQPKNFKHAEREEFTASLDGYDEDSRQAVEIKFSGERDHSLAKQNTVPPHYLAQVDWQYIVSGAREIYYLSYREDDPVILKVTTPTPERVKELTDAASEFLRLVKAQTPPLLSDRDYLEVADDKEAIDLITAYRIKLEHIKGLQESADEIRRKIIARANVYGHGKVDFGSCKVYKTLKQGSVDYSKIPSISGINLDEFRKPPTEITTVKLENDKTKQKPPSSNNADF